jgi:hypothetical protein
LVSSAQGFGNPADAAGTNASADTTVSNRRTTAG